MLHREAKNNQTGPAGLPHSGRSIREDAFICLITCLHGFPQFSLSVGDEISTELRKDRLQVSAGQLHIRRFLREGLPREDVGALCFSPHGLPHVSLPSAALAVLFIMSCRVSLSSVSCYSI